MPSRSTQSLAVMQNQPGPPSFARRSAHIAKLTTILGVVLIVLIIIVPSQWMKQFGFLFPAYLIVASVAVAASLVALSVRSAAPLAASVVVLLGVNIFGILGIAFVYLTFRMSAP